VQLQTVLRYGYSYDMLSIIYFLNSNIYSLRVSNPPSLHENPGAHPITVTQAYKQLSHDLLSRSHPSTQARYKSLNGQVEHPKLSGWIVLSE